MKALVPGYQYQLDHFDDPQANAGQILQFVHRRPMISSSGATHFETVTDGTTNEDIMEVLIHRMEFQAAKLASEHMSKAIVYLRSALYCLNERTRDREARGVQGTPLP